MREFGDKIADGSPAGAGIDPWLLWHPKARTGFPRRRGDRPISRECWVMLPLVPPQARG